jgi:hydrogenase maturation factor
MHDPTEGGLATGLWEMAKASGKGLEVDPAQIHLFPETASFCAALDLDPLGLIASGALLVAAAPGESEGMVAALAADGIGAQVIGKVVDGPPGVRMVTEAGLQPLPTFERDELVKVFG